MAQLFETAAIAFGLAGVADLAAMVDELVGEGDPMVLGQDAHEFLLDFLGCIPFGEAKAAGNAEDMGVDDDAFGLVEADAEDDVGGLAGGAGNGDEFSEGLRDLAFEFCGNCPGCSLDGFGLVVEEACGANEGFKFGQCCLGHGGGGGEAFEQLRCDHVDADVGALGGEDRRHKQFPGGAVGEGALDGGIGFVEGNQGGGDSVGGQVAAL